MEDVVYTCGLVSKLFVDLWLCVELCIDYSVVLFVYRRGVQSMVYGGSIGSIGVFIVLFM